MNAEAITDEQIVAFLDGEADEKLSADIAAAIAADPAMAGRIQDLDLDADRFRQGFDALLDTAPDIAMPEVVTATPPVTSAGSGWGNWRAAAAALILFGAGMGLGWSLSGDDDPVDWHQAVADYQVLYSNATLTNLPMEDAQRQLSLERTGRALGVDLTMDQVTAPGLTFQRAQILSFQGRPLAQLTYLDEAGNPIAFCLTRTDGSDDTPMAQQISGLNANVWEQDGMGFILIGPAPQETLDAAQETLAAKITI